MSGLDSGALDRRIQIYRAGIVRDTHGDDVDGFTAGPTVWASARPGGGRERLVSAQTAAEAPMVFRIRYSSNVANLSASDRIEYPIGSGRMYDIASVNEIGRRDGLEIAATTKAG